MSTATTAATATTATAAAEKAAAADFAGLLKAACMALTKAASTKNTAEKAITAVATAVVNRLLFDKQLDRYQAALDALQKYPDGIRILIQKVTLFAGGFRREEGKYIDIRGTDAQIRFAIIEKGKVSLALPKKGRKAAAAWETARQEWAEINKKTQGLSFSKPKREKMIKYSDILTYLGKIRDQEKYWEPIRRREISTLLSKIESLLD